MATFEEFTSGFQNQQTSNPSDVFSRFLDSNPQATFYGTARRNEHESGATTSIWRCL